MNSLNILYFTYYILHIFYLLNKKSSFFYIYIIIIMITLNNSNINFDSEDTSDESKYTISLSYKSSNFIFKTAGVERLKIMNNGNIGIGVFDTNIPPESKLHIRDNNAKLIIQDSRLVTYGDIYAIRTNNNSQLLPIEIGTDKIEKYVIFTYKGADVDDSTIKQSVYTFTTTTELEVDILIVGGGGAGGDAYGGGGGAGGVVYVKNHILSTGSYQVYVGNGGRGLSSENLGDRGGSLFRDQNGSPSEIRIRGSQSTANFSIGNIRMLADGGGTGGTNSASPSIDGYETENGRAGGSGGGSSGSGIEIDNPIYNEYAPGASSQGITYWNGSSYVKGGNIGRQNPSTSLRDPNFIVGGGGGGIGNEGNNATSGYNGVAIDITGSPQIYAAGGGAGIHVKTGATIANLDSYGLGGSGGIGGNGRIYNGSSYTRPATSGKADSGSGGGGSAYQIGSIYEDAGSGGSGVVIIRYRPLRSTSASIELIRNTYSSNDNNTDYKIGNFDGGFKIISSTSNIDIDRLVVDKNGDITVNRSINASNYLLNGQPFSILDEAKNSSNYVLSTCNLLIKYIDSTNQLNTPSQWNNNENLLDIYYNTGKVGIGITNPANNLHIYNTKSSITNLTIQSDMDLSLAAALLLPPEFFSVYEHDTTKPLNRGTSLYQETSITTGTYGYDKLYKGYEFKKGTYKNFVIETTQDYIVDILIVGAGGPSTQRTESGFGGAGGAGGIVYIVDKKLDAGSYYITVGDSTVTVKGEDSSIKHYNNGTIGEIVTIDGIKLLGKGGGEGRNFTDSSIQKGIGSGGGGFYQVNTSSELRNGIIQDQGNTFWNGNTYTAGGFDGKYADSTIGGNGGGFNNGNGFSIDFFPGMKSSYNIGKAGIVYNDVVSNPTSLNGPSHTGAGGSRDPVQYGKGGSGYVFIKYRKIPQSSSSINLSIGNTKQLSYSISNTNNIFKINSGTSDIMTINSDGNANFKGSLTAKSYIIEGGNDILKDTSNYIASTSNILIRHISTTSNLITHFINNKKSSQWNDRSLTDIYYENNVAIGVTAGTGVYPVPVSKLTINDFIGSFNHSVAPLTITNQTVPTIIDPVDVLHLCRVGTVSGIYDTGMRATFRLGKSVAESTKSKSRLEIALSDGAYNTSNIVMTILSDGKVGIGTTNPTTGLHVNGTITTGTITATSITTTNLTATSFTGSVNVSSALGTLSVANGGTGTNADSLADGRVLFTSVVSGTSTKIIKSSDLFYSPVGAVGTISKLGIGTMPDENSSKLNINPNITSGSFNYSTSPLTITNQTYTNSTTPTDVLHLCRVGIGELPSHVATRATFKLSKWVTPIVGSTTTSDTRLDLELANSTYTNSTNVMTILSSGKIGIGTITSPINDPTKSINSRSSILNINNNIISGNPDTSYDYSESPLTITSQIITTTTTDLKDILHLCRAGYTSGSSTGIRATFRLGIWEGQSSGNSRTRLEIALAHDAYNNASKSVITFLSSGNVGIGTESPSQPLHVQTALRIGGSGPILEFGDNATTQIVRNGTTSELRFKTTSTDRMTIDINGNVGIGKTNPLQKLHVEGEIYSTGEITAFYSDERLKTKISTINNPLSIVNKLNGFYYIPNEIATKYGINKNKIEIGLSAQDVQKVLPELVKLAPFDAATNEAGEIISKSGEKYLTISYERLVPVLIEAIKELEVKNNCLNEKYEDILQEISLINKKINLMRE